MLTVTGGDLKMYELRKERTSPAGPLYDVFCTAEECDCGIDNVIGFEIHITQADATARAHREEIALRQSAQSE